MPFDISTRELLIIAFLIVLFFGGRKIPEFAKILADGIRSLRRGFTDDVHLSEAKKK